MKIWIIGRGLPTKKNPLLGLFEIEQAEMLTEDDEVIYIANSFTLSAQNAISNYGIDMQKKGKLKIYTKTSIFFPGRFNIHFDIYKYMRWKKLIKRIIDDEGEPDIVHLHYPTLIGNRYLFHYFKNHNYKVVCTEHWSKVLLKQLDRYERRLLKSIVEISDCFIAVGNPLRNAIRDITQTNKEIIVIPNAISKEFYKVKKKNHNGFKFIAVGRMVELKQFDKIVNAFCEVFSKYDDVVLQIIGDGQEFDSVQRIIIEKSMQSKVYLVGSMKKEQVAEEMTKADCLICYSKLETFGVPVIESWAVGNPVIVSKSAGVAEYCTDELGIVVNEENTEELVEAIKKIKLEYKRFNSDIISKFAYTHFGYDVVYKSIKHIYGSV